MDEGNNVTERLASLLSACLLIAWMASPGALAGPITFSWHEFSGSGWANVFDGGPPFFDGGSGSGPDTDFWGFLAIDLTQPGSLGASAKAKGESRITDLDDGMSIRVELDTEYGPSFFPGGDNPGGAAEGELFSVIEFVMPLDEIFWAYQLRIDDTIDFDGSTHILFENVTQAETILETTTEIFPPIQTTLTANKGDLLRVTSTMSGGGSTGPASVREYEAFLGMVFLIPEPSALTLLLFALPVLSRRRR